MELGSKYSVQMKSLEPLKIQPTRHMLNLTVTDISEFVVEYL